MKPWSPACALVLVTVSACVDDAPREHVGRRAEALANATLVPTGELEAVGLLGSSQGSCTATLITDTLVLTSAHCVCDDVTLTTCSEIATFTLTDVRPVEEIQKKKKKKTVPGTRQDVDLGETTIVAHPDFGIGTHLANDIAVLKLATPASSRAYVRPIPIGDFLPPVGTHLTKVGYGGTNGATGECEVFDFLKRSGPTAINEVIVGSAPGDVTLRLSLFGANTCPGDSGGPSYVGDAATGEARVVGVTASRGSDKAVFAYREWIGMQGVSPGNRVGSWDLSGAAPATSNYADLLPDPLGLLGWIDDDDVRLVGDFFGRGSDQVLYVNRGGAGGLLRIASYADGASPTESLYWESYGDSVSFDGWLDADDAHLAGDFLNRGHDQLLLINRGGSAGRVMIVDFASGAPQVGYFASYTDDPFLNGWHDVGDGLLAGDFRGVGHDQVMFVNRSGNDGRVLIADFHDGVAPADWVYHEAYADGVELNGWHDAEDLLLAGDFRGLGRDQVMFVNRGPGPGRVLIADFGDGVFPAEWLYLESYGDSTLLDGWHDAADVVLAGDFRNLGYDQAAFVNRNAPWFGRVLVADFHDGVPPASIAFLQNQAMPSALLRRIDPDDHVLAADVRGTGHTGLLTLERFEQ